MKTLKRQWSRLATAIGLTVASIVFLTALLGEGQGVPQPVLTIESMGSNQFLVTITNGDANTSYDLQWRYSLGDPNSSWESFDTNGPGVTSWIVSASNCPVLFLRAAVGNDSDGDGVPNWQDANPYDPSIGILSVTIDSPLNGAALN